jgi:parallel beta-helix repeat protein
VPDDYTTIQKAVNAAKDGYRIFVKSGTYYENIKIRYDSSLTLHGEDKENTIIDANYYSDVIRIEGSATGINISGFTIRNSGDENFGMLISSNYNIIQDNILENNNVGIKLDHSSGNQIWDNEIIDNGEDGILLHRSYANNISGNTITGNGNNGIEFTYSSLGTILDNNEITNHDESGVSLDESSLGNLFTRCTIKENNYGVLCAGVSDGNIFHHNAFIQNNLHAFDTSLDRWDYNGLGNYWDDYKGVDKDGDGVGDTPYVISGGNNKDRYPLMNPAMMYKDFVCKGYTIGNSKVECITVSTGGSSINDGWDIIVPDDYGSIQSAIDHANPGDRIFVRSGIYYENVNISIPGLTLHGEDKETTVIDGGGNGHVVFVDDMADGLNILGFTIKSKENHFTGLYLHSDSTSVEDIICEYCNIGIALRDNENNFVKGNEFVGNNYGIWIWMCINNTLENNAIENNSLDGVALQWSTIINIVSSSIAGNSFNGILEISCSDIVIDGNDICSNSEFGLQMFSSINNIVDGNIIESNDHDGISAYKSTNNSFRCNTIKYNMGDGVSFWFYSYGNCIYSNEIKSNIGDGSSFFHSNNNIISNNNISNHRSGPSGGIFLRFSNNNNINGNTITNNGWGIYLQYSCNNSIASGTFIDHTQHGISLDKYSNHNTICSNTITNSAVAGISLRTSSNNSIMGNNITKNISNGIWLQFLCDYNIISGNIITNNFYGVRAYFSDNLKIGWNTINNSTYSGIHLHNSQHSVVSGNAVISNNLSGIELTSTFDTRISGNTITNNNEYGLFLSDSAFNIIYNNNLIRNTQHALDEHSNCWNSDKKGNYWEDYEEKYPGASKIWLEGIWDTPYDIPGGDNQDRYPLIKPYSKSKVKIDQLQSPIFERFFDRFSLLERFFQHPFFNFDWHPAREPYDIGG